MSDFKALGIGFGFLVLIGGMIFGLILLFSELALLDHIISIQSRVEIFVSAEEMGTKVSSFLRSGEKGETYAETLGNFRAKDYSGEETKEEISEFLKEIKLNITLYDENGEELEKWGEFEDSYKIDIPLPGGRVGKVGI